MEREQFTFYRSFWEALKALPPKDKLPFVTAVCAYAFGEEGESKPLTGQASAAFLLVKPILDKASKKAANGKRGGSSRKANGKQAGSKPEANGKQTGSKPEAEGEKEGEIEGEKEIENDSSPPLPPSPGGNSGQADPFVKFAKGNQALLSALQEFARMRRKIRKPLTDCAKELTVSELQKLSGDPAEQAAILLRSVQRGWQGVFPLQTEAPAYRPRVPAGSAGQGELGELERQAAERLRNEFGGQRDG